MDILATVEKVQTLVSQKCHELVNSGEFIPSALTAKAVIDGDEFLTENRAYVGPILKAWKQANRAKSGNGSIAAWKQDSERLHEIIQLLADQFQANDLPESGPCDWQALCHDVYGIAIGESIVDYSLE